ncbi:sulfite exporter TauE/SafE family protein [Massilia solisilvae]|uniref:Probable membrane transporter protein n=1 Tax=Massilia solisilvae TaxID=1811225 RepID=A0ABT2BHI3_9BURK|nr:sulfite exporter TauE/SafE family protein [Massilia solisilvae]MCS0607975.1 sulfite exporter TauE/SafE family protein [Massilia solisilvae]
MIALALGLVVGIILALTGAGGGILAVPLLVFVAHIALVQAAPIGLLAVGMAAALGALLGLRGGIVRYRAAGLVAGTGMLASPLGLLLAHRIDNRWLSVLFALVLLYVGYRALAKGLGRGQQPAEHAHAARPCVRNAATGRFIWTAPCARALALSGVAAGLLSGLLGVGGGFVMVPALQRYTDLDMQSTVATSLAVIALVSATGVVASAIAGQLDWAVALPFSGGALAGMLGGRAVAARLAGPHLQAGFGAISGAVALGMIAKAVW